MPEGFRLLWISHPAFSGISGVARADFRKKQGIVPGGSALGHDERLGVSRAFAMGGKLADPEAAEVELPDGLDAVDERLARRVGPRPEQPSTRTRAAMNPSSPAALGSSLDAHLGEAPCDTRRDGTVVARRTPARRARRPCPHLPPRLPGPRSSRRRRRRAETPCCRSSGSAARAPAADVKPNSTKAFSRSMSALVFSTVLSALPPSSRLTRRIVLPRMPPPLLSTSIEACAPCCTGGRPRPGPGEAERLAHHELSGDRDRRERGCESGDDERRDENCLELGHECGSGLMASARQSPHAHSGWAR